jgi:hypothetical protein
LFKLAAIRTGKNFLHQPLSFGHIYDDSFVRDGLDENTASMRAATTAASAMDVRPYLAKKCVGDKRNAQSFIERFFNL